MSDNAPTFVGSIPANYQRYLVPMLFEPYAKDIAARVTAQGGKQILELARGSGVVTRELMKSLAPDGQLKATDFSVGMVEEAKASSGSDPRLSWAQADAGDLPFENGQFDTVVCQFGAMFFPNKLSAMREALRVLVPGGRLIFSVWGRIEDNPVFHSVELALQREFPDEQRPLLPTPCSMADPEPVREVLTEAGFKSVEISNVSYGVQGFPASQVSHGFVFGSPVSTLIAELGSTSEEMLPKIEETARRLMGDPMTGSMLAVVFVATA